MQLFTQQFQNTDLIICLPGPQTLPRLEAEHWHNRHELYLINNLHVVVCFCSNCSVLSQKQQDFFFPFFFFLQDGSSESTLLQTRLKDFSLINQMAPLSLNSLCQLRSPWTLWGTATMSYSVLQCFLSELLAVITKALMKILFLLPIL